MKNLSRHTPYGINKAFSSSNGKIYVLLVNVTLMKMLSKNKAVWCYFMDLGKTEKK